MKKISVSRGGNKVDFWYKGTRLKGLKKALLCYSDHFESDDDYTLIEYISSLKSELDNDNFYSLLELLKQRFGIRIILDKHCHKDYEVYQEGNLIGLRFFGMIEDLRKPDVPPSGNLEWVSNSTYKTV